MGGGKHSPVLLGLRKTISRQGNLLIIFCRSKCWYMVSADLHRNKTLQKSMEWTVNRVHADLENLELSWNFENPKSQGILSEVTCMRDLPAL